MSAFLEKGWIQNGIPGAVGTDFVRTMVYQGILFSLQEERMLGKRPMSWSGFFADIWR